uniref:GNAT family N-acetyltransferase n=1 Tax=Roseivirga sp. TaxID=1964215 RepID=UPI0040470BE6
MADIRACSENDLERLQALSVATFRATFEADNNPDDLKAYIDRALNLEKLDSELQKSKSTFYFLEEGKTLIGYLKLNLSPDQSDINDPKSLEIERIYIEKDYHGKGFGKILFDFAVAKAHEHGLKYIWLGVWEKNFKALDFYYKQGFFKFDEHRFKLGTDNQVDYLLRLDL